MFTVRSVQAARRSDREQAADLDRQVAGAGRAVFGGVCACCCAAGCGHSLRLPDPQHAPGPAQEAEEINRSTVYPSRFELFSASELIDGLPSSRLAWRVRAKPPRPRRWRSGRSSGSSSWGSRTKNTRSSMTRSSRCSRPRPGSRTKRRELGDAGITDAPRPWWRGLGRASRR